jgi:DNA replication and repair protein RecF
MPRRGSAQIMPMWSVNTVILKLELTLVGSRQKSQELTDWNSAGLSEFVGSLNVVMFAPEDLEIVKGTPGIRRRFLDMEIGQVQPSYLFHLQQYQKILLQRGNLLKQLWGKEAAGKRASGDMGCPTCRAWC